jgi:hypothetical protein
LKRPWGLYTESIRRSGQCEPNVKMAIEGSEGSERNFACKLSSGHVAINTAFDFDEWARCLVNADMTYVIWIRDYMIQGVSMA